MAGPVFVVSYVLLWLIVLTLCLAVLVVYRVEGRFSLVARSERDRQGPPIGRSLGRRDLTTVSGETVSVGGAQGVSQLIYFASPGCGPCKAATAGLVRLLSAAQNRTASLVVVAAGLARADATVWQREVFSRATVVPDPRMEVMSAFGVYTVPFAILVEASGQVADKRQVGSDWSWLRGQNAPNQSPGRYARIEASSVSPPTSPQGVQNGQ